MLPTLILSVCIASNSTISTLQFAKGLLETVGILSTEVKATLVRPGKSICFLSHSVKKQQTKQDKGSLEIFSHNAYSKRRGQRAMSVSGNLF